MPRKLVSTAFLLLICGTPLAQVGWELSQGRAVQVLDVMHFPREERLRAFEKELHEASFVHELVSPWYQWGLLSVGKGNEKAIVGDDGWLYYRDDLDLITAPGFLQQRESTPIETIVDVRDQLAGHGIELLFVPVPTKTMVDLRHLSRWTEDLDRPANTDRETFFARLAEHGIHTVDLSPVFETQRAQDGDLYLARDTHWTASTMALAAREIGSRARELLQASGSTALDSLVLATRSRQVESAGDMIGMLRVPEGREPFEPMRFEVEQVVDDAGRFVEFDTGAEVLVMGDSFTGVFSDPRFDLGEHGGLGEHLALALGAPVDVIMIAGGAARSVRESLARRGAGARSKRLVIWQISQRDLMETDGRWDRVPFWSPEAEGGDAPPGAGEPVRVLAEIVEVSRVPEGFEYDFCLVVHEYRVLDVRVGALPAGPLWVAHVAIEEFEKRPGGDYPIGARQVLTLEDIALHHDLERTSFVDDTDAGRRIWFATGVAAAD